MVFRTANSMVFGIICRIVFDIVCRIVFGIDCGKMVCGAVSAHDVLMAP